MASELHPSGTQIELRLEDQRAVFVEVGGALRSYELDGVPVLDGYSSRAGGWR
jgi:hypothetical protein